MRVEAARASGRATSPDVSGFSIFHEISPLNVRQAPPGLSYDAHRLQDTSTPWRKQGEGLHVLRTDGVTAGFMNYETGLKSPDRVHGRLPAHDPPAVPSCINGAPTTSVESPSSCVPGMYFEALGPLGPRKAFGAKIIPPAAHGGSRSTARCRGARIDHGVSGPLTSGHRHDRIRDSRHLRRRPVLLETLEKDTIATGKRPCSTSTAAPRRAPANVDAAQTLLNILL